MNKIISLRALTKEQTKQYRDAIIQAFPPIIGKSPVIEKHWSKLEESFSDYQFMLIGSNEELIGFMNTVPFAFENVLGDLPDTGWDWMFTKGISDLEHNVSPTYLGGLQVIVRSKYQNQGHSKTILNYVKEFVQKSTFQNLVIPIRPTRKQEFPAMQMSEYLDLREDDKIYDPWVRTHLNNGAEIIKVCGKSMQMRGDLKFWEDMLGQELDQSGSYKLKGALSLININVDKDYGEYVEPNVWIMY